MNSQPRHGRIAWAMLSVVAAAGFSSVVLHGAAGETLSAATASADDRPAAKAPEKPTFEQLFQDWPSLQESKPAFVVALTGEMSGYLRPCGCSEGQGGGLPRRAAALAYLRDEFKLDVLPLDLGDVVGNTLKIEEMRFDAARNGLAKLGYKVVGVGQRDLSLSLLTLAQKLANSPPTLKTILGNLAAKDKDLQSILAESAKPIEIVEIAGKKVAVGFLMDPAFEKESTEFKLEALETASAAMLKAADAEKPAAKVLLAYMEKDKAIAFAKDNQGWDLIMTRSSGDDAHGQLDQHREGTSLIVSAGRKGKWIGVAGFWPENKFKFRYAAVEVSARYFTTDDGVEKIYNDLVKEIHDADVLSSMSKVQHVSRDEYVGAEACGKCHTKAYKKWSEEIAGSTHGKGHGHAFAFESLKKDRAKYQTSNPDCVSCHTTGFEYVSGFVTEAKSPKLLGNQCENCHGPGKKHSDNKDDLALRKQMKLSQTDVADHCKKCHDADNSVHFKFETYWPKIAHPWRD